MRPVGTPQELEMRRRLAIELLESETLSVAEVAESFGVTQRAVYNWRRSAQQGPEGLTAKPRPNPARKLSDQQLAELVQIMTRGAKAAGFSSELWTCARVADVIQKEFGVEYDLGHLSRLLRRLNFSPQKPQPVARERDPEAGQQWRKVEWPRIKKGRR